MLKTFIVALTAVAARSLELHHAGGGHLGAVSYSSIASPFGQIVHHEHPVHYHETTASPVTYVDSVPIAYRTPVAHPASVAYQTPVAYRAPAAYLEAVGQSAPAAYSAAVAYSGPTAYPATVGYPSLATHSGSVATVSTTVPVERDDVHEDDLPAQYNFGYGISDPATGDVKEQQESRQGDNVQGRYSLIEADGTRRVVEYSADADGFHAVVHKESASVSVPVTAPATASLVSSPIVRSFQPVGLPYGAIHQPHIHVAAQSRVLHVH